ncbi:hypothetical protein KUV26_22650 [Leisingera daeponensis]|uniref:Secreted protein n=1 Tax=Leisingera daeponensis TaxID=405746 RepID=A0ABS7NQ19_9RHOB|nr:hypothetical protein [Leisingera daeponensis]MBY6142236.1 hypothetical protein [Leisingera daeponensis]
MTRISLPAAVLLCITAAATASAADEQAAIDGCISQLKTVGGPDAAGGGEVLGHEWSQAGTNVRLKDAGGTVWECIAYDDGAVGDLRVVEAADDGGGALAGAGGTGPITVHFQPGTTGATYDGTLGAGEALQYVLGAKEGQFLNVQVVPDGGAMDYQIMNPDGSRLLDMIDAGKPYEGQLWQSGNHVVEIVNKTSSELPYRIEFSIR